MFGEEGSRIWWEARLKVKGAEETGGTSKERCKQHTQRHPKRKCSRNQPGCSASSSLTSGSRKKVYGKWELGQITKDSYEGSISMWGDIRKGKLRWK